MRQDIQDQQGCHGFWDGHSWNSSATVHRCLVTAANLSIPAISLGFGGPVGRLKRTQTYIFCRFLLRGIILLCFSSVLFKQNGMDHELVKWIQCRKCQKHLEIETSSHWDENCRCARFPVKNRLKHHLRKHAAKDTWSTATQHVNQNNINPIDIKFIQILSNVWTCLKG